jgi:hypothetical protein
LIIKLTKTDSKATLKGVLVSCTAKKQGVNIFTTTKAGRPSDKICNIMATLIVSKLVKEPLSNKMLIIGVAMANKANVLGRVNNIDISRDLFFKA